MLKFYFYLLCVIFWENTNRFIFFSLFTSCWLYNRYLSSIFIWKTKLMSSSYLLDFFLAVRMQRYSWKSLWRTDSRWTVDYIPEKFIVFMFVMWNFLRLRCILQIHTALSICLDINSLLSINSWEFSSSNQQYCLSFSLGPVFFWLCLFYNVVFIFLFF